MGILAKAGGLKVNVSHTLTYKNDSFTMKTLSYIPPEQNKNNLKNQTIE
ncbi:hypothetical protein AH4AK4_2264 [Aeromonas hydrophila 4AK4]|nr:hypothetical protein AH4AK4_2264 [Aeromonas hydrophila 4AK4]